MQPRYIFYFRNTKDATMPKLTSELCTPLVTQGPVFKCVCYISSLLSLRGTKMPAGQEGTLLAHETCHNTGPV